MLLFGRRTGSGGGADLRRCGGAAAGDRHRLAGGGVSGAAVYVPVLRAAKYGPDPAVLLHRVAAAMHPAHPDSGMLLPAAGGEVVGDRTGGSGAYRGLRGAGKLAERPKTNRIRIRGRSFLNVLLFSYKENFCSQNWQIFNNRNVQRGIIPSIRKMFRILDMWKLHKIIR